VIIIKHFQKVSFYSNNLNEKWNGKVGEGAIIALYHWRMQTDVNNVIKRPTRLEVGKKQKAMVCNYMDCFNFFTGLLKYDMPMTDHTFCVKPLRTLRGFTQFVIRHRHVILQ